MQVVFVMFLADGARRSFPLTRDVTVIGRREDCDLRIPLTEISRKHCRVVKDSKGIRLEDLGSSNGTYHNGSRVQESVLQAGDQLRIGPVNFTVQIDGYPTDAMITAPQAENAAASDELDILHAPSETSLPDALSGRPLAPQGDDFALASDEATADEDLIDMGTIISPSDDEDLNK